MNCPYCRHLDSRVIDSRTADDGAAIRRRRSCPACGRRFTTQETVILMVGKRSGVTEPFARDKISRGVRRACQGRPVSEDQLAILAQRVEDTIRARGCGEVPSHEVGLAILQDGFGLLRFENDADRHRCDARLLADPFGIGHLEAEAARNLGGGRRA